MTSCKRLRQRLDTMTDATYNLLRGALLVTCSMGLAALALFHFGGGATLEGFEAYKTAHELVATGAVTLLIATIASAVIEDLTMQK